MAFVTSCVIFPSLVYICKEAALLGVCALAEETSLCHGQVSHVFPSALALFIGKRLEVGRKFQRGNSDL